MHSQPLSIAITEWVDDSDSQSENKPHRRGSMKIKLVMLCAHSGYEASFEACFVDLGCLEKHIFSSALLENSRKHHGIAINSHKAYTLKHMRKWARSQLLTAPSGFS